MNIPEPILPGLSTDEFYMNLALSVSRKAFPTCLPNPPVGCVLVRNGSVLCEGYTHGPGQFHAEAHALSQVQGFLDDTTAYVTLEPCSFRGRTSSCALSLIERRIKRVVVALVDPDSRNNGNGINLLREAGVEVTIGVLDIPTRDFIAPYLDLASNKVSACTCDNH